MKTMQEVFILENDRSIAFRKRLTQMLPDDVNPNLCLTCGSCSSGCPATGMENMDPRKFVRMVMLGMEEELTMHPWVWLCSMCQRCTHVCPMGIDIAAMVFECRKLWPRDQRPRGILRSCDMALRNDSCSAMGTPEEDFRFVVEDVLEEVRETQPGWEDLQAPIDKEGAHFFLSQNSREPVTEPEEMVPLWKILHLAGADWTYSCTGWGGENYCMFLADDDGWKRITDMSIRQAEKLGCKVYLNTECGHSTYSVWMGRQRHRIETDLEIAPMVKYYAQWIREGKLKVASDWNTDGIKFTVQDPCNIIRKGFGDELADDLRFVIKACIGEENFIDTTPNKSNNFCCGGGGGYLQSGYRDERLNFGRIKNEQIVRTGAPYVVTPCHNCHAQIEELGEHYEGGYRALHLWSLIALSLGILSENERAYLGPDLLKINLPGY